MKFKLPVLLAVSLIVAALGLMETRSEVHAAPSSTIRLMEDQQFTLPITYYDDYGNETTRKSIFRTDGDYEWRWTIGSASDLTFPADEHGNVFYRDYNNVYYGVNHAGSEPGGLLGRKILYYCYSNQEII